MGLLQAQIDNVNAGDVAQFFAGLALVLSMYTVALLFTYWISKDE